ncbi:MAG: hypothetical protein PF448_01555 [Bacteroidales bacterium]|jgi:hypothetical protein|nr:hypothetical protein [Bacteroidales bacterium]
MKRVFSKFSIDKFAIFILILAMFFNMLNTKSWKQPNGIIYWDVISYYGYLPATFIYKDLSLKFKDNYEGDHHFVIWANKTPNGNYAMKTSMGLSYLYAPWFFIGHAVALNTDYDAGGYSVPYNIALQFGILFYLLIGLIFLRKVLRRYFNAWITALTMISVIVGTNLYFYIVYKAAVSHSYNFILFSIFIWLVIKWHEKRSWKHTILLGLTGGLITLIRPTNIIVLLLLLLWDVTSFSDLKKRFSLFIREYRKILVMAGVFILIWIPQFIYWKTITGSLFYYSYGDEGFFFLQPKFFKSLFSYRSGWLVYSPIMAIALIGFPFMIKQKTKEALTPILLFTFINMWIIFSWWCWWWGGSFGLRPLTDSYAFLALPFASFIFFISKQKRIWIKIVGLSLVVLLNAYGIYMTVKYVRLSIHNDGMNKELFWYNFTSVKTKKNFWDRVTPPDYDRALRGLDEKPTIKLTPIEKIRFKIKLDNQIINSTPLKLNEINTFRKDIKDTLIINKLNKLPVVFFWSKTGSPTIQMNKNNALQTKRHEFASLKTLPRDAFFEDTIYNLSFYYRFHDDFEGAYFYLVQVDSAGEHEWTDHFPLIPAKSPPGWEFISLDFDIKPDLKSLKINFHHPKYSNSYEYFSDFLIIPKDSVLIFPINDSLIFRNNEHLSVD